MFKLYKISDTMYAVIARIDGIDRRGTIEQMIVVMQDLGASSAEIQYALDEMEANDHNCADFGMNINNGSSEFIFSNNVSLFYGKEDRPVFLPETNAWNRLAS